MAHGQQHAEAAHVIVELLELLAYVGGSIRKASDSGAPLRGGIRWQYMTDVQALSSGRQAKGC